MAFSHVQKAFRPIRSDSSKHTTDFIQQVLAMAQGSTRFKQLGKSIDDYIIELQNKIQELTDNEKCEGSR